MARLVSEQGKAFLGSQESPGLPPGEWPTEMVKGPESRSVLMARNPTHLGSIQCLYLGLIFKGQAGPSSSVFSLSSLYQSFLWVPMTRTRAGPELAPARNHTRETGQWPDPPPISVRQAHPESALKAKVLGKRYQSYLLQAVRPLES